MAEESLDDIVEDSDVKSPNKSEEKFYFGYYDSGAYKKGFWYKFEKTFMLGVAPLVYGTAVGTSFYTGNDSLGICLLLHGGWLAPFYAIYAFLVASD